MIPELGHFALILALCFSVVQAVFPLAGAQLGISSWINVAKPAARMQFAFTAIAFGCLTWSQRLAQQLLCLVESGKRGLYHAVGEGSASWFQVASHFLELMEVEHSLVPCTTAEYPTRARRPANSILLNRRLKDEGLLLMKVGEKFRFILSPDLAYGEQGNFPVIPPNSTITFDVELLEIMN